MTTYLDLYAVTHEYGQRAATSDLNVQSARKAGYTEAGVRSLITSVFSAAR